jgi:iron complex transport system substrate-binding protein
LIILACLSCRETGIKSGLRIVSLSPGMTETIFALGAERDLVGVTTYCDYPEAARKLPRVGDFSHPSLERIIALKPGLVIVNRPEQNRMQFELEAFKIPVFATEAGSLEGIYRDIVELGRRIGRSSQAESLVAGMRRKIRPGGGKARSVYIELSPRPLITIGRDNFLNEMVEMAGGKNIFDDLDRSYPAVSQEEVIKRDPEMIIVLHPEGIKDRIGWNRIRAVRENRIHQDLNQDILLRPGPRLAQGFEALEELFD